MKKLMKIMPVVLVMCLVLTNAFAVPSTFPTTGTGSTTLNTAAQNVWGTVVTIVQILAFAALVFAGVRYMFASADQKADIKKGMGYLALGAILVFAASSVIKLFMDTANEIF